MNKRDLISGIIGMIIVFGLIAFLSFIAISGAKIDKAISEHYQTHLDSSKIFEA